MANDICYVCVSDFHIGEEDSLLTNLKAESSDIDTLKSSPTLEKLAKILKYLIDLNQNGKKPTLILNGDILELALTTTNEAVMAFDRFIDEVMEKGNELFSDIIYLAGNHDHHLWETARETQYVNYLKEVPHGEKLKIPWHTTNIFHDNDIPTLQSYFLTKIFQRHEHLSGREVFIAYPSFGLVKNEKMVIFNHGHFIEPLYQLMSTIKNVLFPDREMPDDMWEIEAENFAWIDFFWSTMGRSGEVGHDVELIYEKMQSPKEFKKFLSQVAKTMAKKYDIKYVPNFLEAKLLKWLFHKIYNDHVPERGHAAGSLSPDSEKGLRALVQGPILKQIKNEKKIIPEDVTFIFGHTHKPFQKEMDFEGFPKDVKVYNTGGWVVDKVKPENLHGGSIILLDEDLNSTALRLYNEYNNASDYVVKAECLTTAGQSDSPFHQRISELVDNGNPVWNNFSKTVAKEVDIRIENLKIRITG